ncbi:MAG: hypothetical protein JWQ14_1616 [Adhaeribacter sp.]|nr:hypothetical protein [Adhaeribacter sp.]
MNNEKFKQKMAALEKEREAYIARLTPEGQQEFKQKQKEFNELQYISDSGFRLFPGDEKSARKDK